MTIATKNGSVILKSGSVAQNCGCCGGWYCYLPSQLVRVDFTKHPQSFNDVWSAHSLRNFYPVTSLTTQATLDSYRATALQQYNNAFARKIVPPHASTRVLSKVNDGYWSGSLSLQDSNGYTYGEFWEVFILVQSLSECLNRIHLTQVRLPSYLTQLFTPDAISDSEFKASVVCTDSSSLKLFQSWGVQGQPINAGFPTAQWRPATFASHFRTDLNSIDQVFSIGTKFVDTPAGQDAVFFLSGTQVGFFRTQVAAGGGAFQWPESCVDGPQGEVFTEVGTASNEFMDGSWAATITVRV